MGTQKRGTTIRGAIIHAAQRVLLVLSYRLHRLFDRRSLRNSIDWVVGPAEIASMTQFIAAAIPQSCSVVLRPNPYYRDNYDIMLRGRYWVGKMSIVSPILLGRLINRARGFIYVGSSFLSAPDFRRAEFAYLKRHGLGLVCYWTGTDIRSTAKMRALEEETGRPNITTYITEIANGLEGPRHEEARRQTAAIADQYADATFVYPHANLNYLTRPSEPFLYLFPDERFRDLEEKFDRIDVPVLTHASSSPIIKGTPLVRAAITRLRKEGYTFEYNELIGADNATVLETLSRTHISIGHFYGFTPGVYGVESLAAMCALVTSASEKLEPCLPSGSDTAWYVTSHDEVYKHLRTLLDNPQRIRELALEGHSFARQHFSKSANAPELNRVLDAVLAGTARTRGSDRG